MAKSILLSLFFLVFCDFHKDNWAVIVDVSNFWYNIRHETNALEIYHMLHKNGFPHSHIILMISDDFQCNPRNPEQNSIYSNPGHYENLCKDGIVIDYKGYEVTEENLLRVLTGNYVDNTPSTKKLLSTDQSNVLVYLTGHGGDNFLKFRDKSAITGTDLANAIDIMYRKKRYKNLFCIADTCEAESLFVSVTSPHFFSVTSSSIGESSYAMHLDPAYALSSVDRFTYLLSEYMRNDFAKNNSQTVGDFFHRYLMGAVPGGRRIYTSSTPVLRMDLADAPANEILLADYLVFRPQVSELDIEIWKRQQQGKNRQGRI